MSFGSLQPCVYVRWALHKLGKSDSTAYVVNGVLMLVTFFLARNVFGIGASLGIMPMFASLCVSFTFRACLRLWDAM